MPLTKNRSMPESTVIPVLSYPDVQAAVEWLCKAFGFRQRLRISDHRAQLDMADAGIVVRYGLQPASNLDRSTHAVMVRITDLRSHHRRATSAGARIASPPTTCPYGERQYTAVDPWGHVWTFSETIIDSDPATWGGVLHEDGIGAA
jgi:uncharacterized glyoxalase superfamily protein PhnB